MFLPVITRFITAALRENGALSYPQERSERLRPTSILTIIMPLIEIVNKVLAGQCARPLLLAFRHTCTPEGLSCQHISISCWQERPSARIDLQPEKTFSPNRPSARIRLQPEYAILSFALRHTVRMWRRALSLTQAACLYRCIIIHHHHHHHHHHHQHESIINMSRPACPPPLLPGRRAGGPATVASRPASRRRRPAAGNRPAAAAEQASPTPTT
jgi:hypothetical protein